MSCKDYDDDIDQINQKLDGVEATVADVYKRQIRTVGFYFGHIPLSKDNVSRCFVLYLIERSYAIFFGHFTLAGFRT